MLNFILLIALIILMLPVSFLLVQVLAAILLVKPAPSGRSPVIRPTIAVLMPAHNESLVISQTDYNEDLLLKQSELRLHKIFILHESLIASKITSVHDLFMAAVINKLLLHLS